jgi:probable HAF family extracellular repeat protein
MKTPAFQQVRAAMLTLLVAIPALGFAQTYTVTDLGVLKGDTFSGANAINASGQVTGFSGSEGVSDVILYSGGVLSSLGNLGGATGIGLAINSSGEVAGYSLLAQGSYRGFFNSNGQMNIIDPIGQDYTDARAINDAGQVAGATSTATTGLEETHPYLFSNGKMIDLGTLGGHGSLLWNTAEGINKFGDVVGYSWLTSGTVHAFMWTNGVMKDLGALPGNYSLAFAINDKREVTGSSYTGNSFQNYEDAFLYSNGKMKDLGTITGQFSFGFGINNSGVVVGQSTYTVDGTSYHAFVYRHGKMEDLNRLIPANSGWLLMTAYGINDAGQIVGYGVLNGNYADEHGFLLTPQ